MNAVSVVVLLVVMAVLVWAYVAIRRWDRNRIASGKAKPLGLRGRILMLVVAVVCIVVGSLLIHVG